MLFSDTDTTLYRAQVSLWRFAADIAEGLLLAAFGVTGFLFWEGPRAKWLLLAGVLGVSMVARALLRRRGVSIRITAHHVVVRHTLLSLHSTTLSLNRIESVDIDQSLFARLMGFGRVTIRGMGSEDLVFQALSDPEGLKNAITSAQMAQRSEPAALA